MFIRMGPDRRININAILEYRPFEKSSFYDKRYYSVKIKFISGIEEEISFFESQEKRDDFLKLLDKNLLTIDQ
jgi:hypothetical protein